MKKNVLALFLGCVIAVLFFLSAEFFFQINKSLQLLPVIDASFPARLSPDVEASTKIFEELKGLPVFQWSPQSSFEAHESLLAENIEFELEGGNIPCCIWDQRFGSPERVTARKVIKKDPYRIVVENTYNLDRYGRRKTPQVKDPKAYVLTFGDSYTLGQAVEDQESFPYQLGVLRPRTQVYNYGLAGGGPNEFLFELENDPAKRLSLKADVPTTILYTYNDNHLDRLMCRSSCMGTENAWLQALPFYQWEDQQVAFKGFFSTDRPLKNALYNLVNESALLSYFHVVWPLRFTERDFDFFAQVLLAAQKKSASLFPGSDFYVALYPGASKYYGAQIKMACEKLGLKVLDYSKISTEIATGGRRFVPGDEHPSPITQFVFAWLLNADLSRAEVKP